MELEFLQKKYPEFIYESCDWEITGNDLVARFCFRMGEIRFEPGIIIHGIDKEQLGKIKKIEISNLVFNMGLAEIPSYWKAACSPRIIIKAGYLDRVQIKFWQDLIFNMGQFFYENKLPFIKPDFEIVATKPKEPTVIAQKFAANYLVPLGGGKDSLVSLEILRGQRENLATFTLNANIDLKKVAQAAGCKNIFVERKIDRKIIELNTQGYLNGHTPFSSVLAVLGVGLAAIFGHKYVAISQERSSNEGNVDYLGKNINHQYSKTLEFENKFRKYSKKYLSKDIEYFSILRPLYEIQISMIFSGYPQYFDHFLSCNKPFTLEARDRGLAGWCGKCSKCLSVFAMIYPFVGKETAVKIFGHNLFDDKNLLPLMMELSGQAESKPMECVGTFDEMRAAFYLSLDKTSGVKPFLLEYFQKNIMPEYPQIKEQSQKILSSWTNKHNLPKPLVCNMKSVLKSYVTRLNGLSDKSR